MKKLHTSKNLAALRKKTKLVPKRRQETRWSGTFTMIERFLQLVESINEAIEEDTLNLQKRVEMPNFSSASSTTMVTSVNLMLDNSEINRIREIKTKLIPFEAVSKELQSHDQKKMNMLNDRLIFD
jgi:hypothetical protein